MSDGARMTRASVRDSLTVQTGGHRRFQLLHDAQQLSFGQVPTARKSTAQVDDLSELKKIAEGATTTKTGRRIGGGDG